MPPQNTGSGRNGEGAVGGEVLDPPTGDQWGNAESRTSGSGQDSSDRSAGDRAAAGSRHGGMPDLMWLMIPLGLILFVAASAVILQGDRPPPQGKP